MGCELFEETVGPYAAGARELTWPELWALGRIELGLAEDEFWALEPVDLDALIEAQERRQRRDDLRWASLYAVIVNSNPFRDGDPVSAEDFLPAPPPDRSQEEINRTLVAQLMAWSEASQRRN